MIKGTLYEKCLEYRKTFCIHEPIENEKGEIEQKIHDAFRWPSKEEIKEALDKAKEEFPTIYQTRFINSTKKGIFLGFFWEDYYKELLQWFKRSFGE